MKTTCSNAVGGLSDDELVARVKALAERQRTTTAELIVHLSELEGRGLHLKAGYGSLFEYCCQALLLSEAEAFARIKAARAARRFPVIVEMLERGEVNLTTVRLLGPLLTTRNHREVLRSARGLSKRKVEELIARLAPAPDVPTTIRKLPTATALATPASADTPPGIPPPIPPPTPAVAAPVSVDAPAISAPAVCAPANARAAAVQPLSPDRYKLQVTIDGATLEKLEQARDRLRHAVPSGDAAEILDRALAALLASLDKKQRAAAEMPRPSAGATSVATCVTAESRHIPARVTRAVYDRDEGRCAYVAADGRRCHAQAFIERHHVEPYAGGGPATVGNIALRCRRHNGYEWQRRVVERHALEERWHRLPRGRVLQAAARATGSGTRPVTGDGDVIATRTTHTTRPARAGQADRRSEVTGSTPAGTAAG